MRKLHILLLSAALASGCAWNTPQVAAQRTIQTTTLAKDQVLKAWAVYVVTKENSGTPDEIAKLWGQRAQISALNDEFNATASVALDLALADTNAISPPKLTKLATDIAELVATFKK